MSERNLVAARQGQDETNAQSMPELKKVYKSLTDFANDGYQWLQVAELGDDAFMVRHRLSG